jgi:O-antigen/teichoic acid export membrane protein
LSSLKKLASQTAVYGLSQILGKFVNYLLTPLHTKLLEPLLYGVNTLMYGYVTFFNVLLTYGMETAFFRFSQKKENPSQVYSTALTSLVSTSLVFMLLLSVFSGPLASLIGIGEHSEYVVYFAVIISLDAICAIPFAYLRHQNKALRFAIIKNTNIFANILLNLYFFLLCPYLQKQYGILAPFYHGQAEVGYIFVSNLIATIITVPLLGKEILEIKKATFSKPLWREMLVYGLPLMVVGFAGMINEALDRIIISYLYPTEQEGLVATGIYGANYKLSILMSLFIQAFRYAAEPFFFSQAKTDDKRTVYATVMNYFVLVCLVLFLTVTLYIDIFKYFIDVRYWEGLNVVPILLVANMFLGIYYNLTIWYKLSDQTNKGAIISIIGAVITIAANLMLVPFWGYTGSAWATLICYLGMTIICYLMGMKYYPVPYQTGKVVGYILFALVLFFVSKVITPTFGNAITTYSINALLLAIFVSTAFWVERVRPR